MKIYAGDYDAVADAALVLISAGAGQKPGETRLDLVNKNVAIFKSIIPEIAKRNFEGIMLVVSNPVDILTQVAIKLSGLPENRVCLLYTSTYFLPVIPLQMPPVNSSLSVFLHICLLPSLLSPFSLLLFQNLMPGACTKDI